jgi:hypothetical protein
LAGVGVGGEIRLRLLRAAKGGRFRFSSRCAFLAQRDALGVHASLDAEPPALRWVLAARTEPVRASTRVLLSAMKISVYLYCSQYIVRGVLTYSTKIFYTQGERRRSAYNAEGGVNSNDNG